MYMLTYAVTCLYVYKIHTYAVSYINKFPIIIFRVLYPFNGNFGIEFIFYRIFQSKHEKKKSSYYCSIYLYIVYMC